MNKEQIRTLCNHASVYWTVDHPWREHMDLRVPTDMKLPGDCLAGVRSALAGAEVMLQAATERRRDRDQLAERLLLKNGIPDELRPGVFAQVAAVTAYDLRRAMADRDHWQGEITYWTEKLGEAADPGPEQDDVPF